MSERIQRYLLWLFAGVLVVGTGLALRYARGYRPVAGLFAPAPPLPADVVLRFEHVRVVGRSNNQRAWELTAGRVDTTRARSRVDFSQGTKATLLSNQKPRAVFTAPQATYNVGEKMLVAAGQLTCRVLPPTPHSGEDLRIDANQMIWNVGSSTINCPGAVRAQLAGLTVSGQDLAVDLRTRDHSLKHIVGSLRLNDEGTPDVPDPETLKGLVQ